MHENELSKLFHLASALTRHPKRHARWIALAASAAPLNHPSSAMKDAIEALSKEFKRQTWKERDPHRTLTCIGHRLMKATSDGPVSAGRALLYAVEQGNNQMRKA